MHDVVETTFIAPSFSILTSAYMPFAIHPVVVTRILLKVYTGLQTILYKIGLESGL